MIYAIAIAGLNMATGYTGMVSVGHSAFFGLGAYTTGILIVQFGWQATYTSRSRAGVFRDGARGGAARAANPGLYLAMVTLAFGVAFPEIIDRLPRPDRRLQRPHDPPGHARPPEWTGLSLNQKGLYLYWLSAVLLVVVMILVSSLLRSRYGLALIAVRDNEIAAAASGVNLAVVKTVSFGLSGALTGSPEPVRDYLGSLVADDSFTLLSAIVLLTGLIDRGTGDPVRPRWSARSSSSTCRTTRPTSGRARSSAVLFGAALIAIIFIVPEGIVGGASRVVRRFVRVLPAPPRRDGCLRRPTTPDVPGAPWHACDHVPTPAGRSEDA